jgi:hypothetical protein
VRTLSRADSRAPKSQVVREIKHRNGKEEERTATILPNQERAPTALVNVHTPKEPDQQIRDRAHSPQHAPLEPGRVEEPDRGEGEREPSDLNPEWRDRPTGEPADASASPARHERVRLWRSPDWRASQKRIRSAHPARRGL